MKIPRVPTGLFDIKGREIHTGDKIRFLRAPEKKGPVWDAYVIFEDGCFTVDCYGGYKQIKAPAGWKQKHEWTRSRDWACLVGYPEFGTWNCYRVPLTKIQSGFTDYDKYYNPLCQKYGVKRFINVAIVSAKQKRAQPIFVISRDEIFRIVRYTYDMVSLPTNRRNDIRFGYSTEDDLIEGIAALKGDSEDRIHVSTVCNYLRSIHTAKMGAFANKSLIQLEKLIKLNRVKL